MPQAPQTQEDWLKCLALPDYVAMIPAGCIRPIVGPIIWTDGNGTQMGTQAYIKRWGFDPQIAWDAIKAYRKEAGKKDKTVVL